jgi:lipopolysaccharide heptosyltransferase II
MFDDLDIQNTRERLLVGLADRALGVAALPGRLMPARPRATPRRVLLLRLERIGDLLMSVGAITEIRRRLPDATIDLVVGSWNEALARLLPVNTVEVLDAPWLARDTTAGSIGGLLGQAAGWRGRHYDLAINLEGDIRSNLLTWTAGAKRRVGFGMAGGGPLLTDVVPYDATRHVAANLAALVERSLDLPAGSVPAPPAAAALDAARIVLPDRARASARASLAQLAGGRLPASLLGLHTPGGRAIKQWPAERFAEAASRLAREMDASVVLTGGPDDHAIVEEAESRLAAAGVRTLRLDGTSDLVILAGILAQCRLLLTGDTGPMHLAAAVGTPIVAVFGPSMPWRYAPLVADHRIVRVDLPCSPCNRIRQPPERCVGHTPDCLVGVTTEMVVAAGRDLLASTLAIPRP